MSWCNVIPWWAIAKRMAYQDARTCCAFENELHTADMREDWL